MARRPPAIALLVLILAHSVGVWEASCLPPEATPSAPSGDEDFFPLALAYRQEALDRITLPDTVPYAPVAHAPSPEPFEQAPWPDARPDTSPCGPGLLYSLMSLRC